MPISRRSGDYQTRDPCDRRRLLSLLRLRSPPPPVSSLTSPQSPRWKSVGGGGAHSLETSGIFNGRSRYVNVAGPIIVYFYEILRLGVSHLADSLPPLHLKYSRKIPVGPGAFRLSTSSPTWAPIFKIFENKSFQKDFAP